MLKSKLPIIGLTLVIIFFGVISYNVSMNKEKIEMKEGKMGAGKKKWLKDNKK